jgi:hypothetical protein
MELLKFPATPRSNSFDLDVPFNDQNDNSPNKGQGPGWRHCFATSCAMLAKYFKPNLWTNYRDFANGYLDVLRPFGDTTVANSHIRALRTLGIEAYYTERATIQRVANSLYRGVPVPIGVKYKVSGHWKIIKGIRPGQFIAHDPYGKRRGTSDDWIAIGNGSGRNDVLSASWMNSCFVDLGPDRGYAVFVTSVDGRPTGVS